MSWGNDDGTHEGYVLPEFADGTRGTGTSGGGVPDDQIIVGTDYLGEPGAITETRHTTRPSAEVVGWRVMCDCRRPGSSGVSADWTSDLLVRVPSQALEDLDAGRIYAVDDDVIDVSDRDDVLDAAVRHWRREHVDSLDALARIRSAREATQAAGRELDAAVVAARVMDASWEAIGRAAGISRQSAHARWA